MVPLRSCVFGLFGQTVPVIDVCASRLSLHPGLELPRLTETEVRQRVQDPPAGTPRDSGDGRRERAQGADGRAHAGGGGLAPKHVHAAGTELAGQQHRRHSPQEEKGQDLSLHMLIDCAGFT